jgi:hypothetical protein
MVCWLTESESGVYQSREVVLPSMSNPDVFDPCDQYLVRSLEVSHTAVDLSVLLKALGVTFRCYRLRVGNGRSVCVHDV